MGSGRILGTVGVLCAAVLALAGCRTVYSGYESGIDSVQWRQISAYEDPFWERMGPPDSIDSLLGKTGGIIWDGVSPADELGISAGALVLYDIRQTDERFEFGVFISSGPRPNRPADYGGPFTGPSQVFTCYELSIPTGDDEYAESDRDLDVECPEELVALMPADAAFATGDVFDG